MPTVIQHRKDCIIIKNRENHVSSGDESVSRPRTGSWPVKLEGFKFLLETRHEQNRDHEITSYCSCQSVKEELSNSTRTRSLLNGTKRSWIFERNKLTNLYWPTSSKDFEFTRFRLGKIVRRHAELDQHWFYWQLSVDWNSQEQSLGVRETMIRHVSSQKYILH